MAPKSRKLPSWFIKSANEKQCNKNKKPFLRRKAQMGDSIKRTIYCMSPEEFQHYAEELLKEVGEKDTVKKNDITSDIEMGNKDTHGSGNNIYPEKCLHLKSRKQCNLHKKEASNVICDDTNVNNDEIMCKREDSPKYVGEMSTDKNARNLLTKNRIDLNYIDDPLGFYSANILTKASSHLNIASTTTKTLLPEKLYVPETSRHDKSKIKEIPVEIKDSIPDTVLVPEVELNYMNNPIIYRNENVILKDVTSYNVIATSASHVDIPSTTTKSTHASASKSLITETESFIADTVPVIKSPPVNYSILDELM